MAVHGKLKCQIGTVPVQEWSLEEIVDWAEKSLPIKVRSLHETMEHFFSSTASECIVPTMEKDEMLLREANIMENKDAHYKICAVEISDQGVVAYLAGRNAALVKAGGYGTIKVWWCEHASVAVECIIVKPERELELLKSIFYSRGIGSGFARPQEIIMTYDEAEGYKITRHCPKPLGGYINPEQVIMQQFAPRNALDFL